MPMQMNKNKNKNVLFHCVCILYVIVLGLIKKNLKQFLLSVAVAGGVVLVISLAVMMIVKR